MAIKACLQVTVDVVKVLWPVEARPYVFHHLIPPEVSPRDWVVRG